MSEWNPEILAMIVGILLSLAFSYIPGADGWWANLASEYKRLIMLGLLALVSVAAYLLSCVIVVVDFVTCDQQGIMKLIQVFIFAVVANQGAYSISPRKQGLREIIKG